MAMYQMFIYSLQKQWATCRHAANNYNIIDNTRIQWVCYAFTIALRFLFRFLFLCTLTHRLNTLSYEMCISSPCWAANSCWITWFHSVSGMGEAVRMQLSSLGRGALPSGMKRFVSERTTAWRKFWYTFRPSCVWRFILQYRKLLRAVFLSASVPFHKVALAPLGFFFLARSGQQHSYACLSVSAFASRALCKTGCSAFPMLMIGGNWRKSPVWMHMGSRRNGVSTYSWIARSSATERPCATRRAVAFAWLAGVMLYSSFHMMPSLTTLSFSSLNPLMLTLGYELRLARS